MTEHKTPFDRWLEEDWDPFRENEWPHLSAKVDVQQWWMRAQAVAWIAVVLKILLG